MIHDTAKWLLQGRSLTLSFQDVSEVHMQGYGVSLNDMDEMWDGGIGIQK